MQASRQAGRQALAASAYARNACQAAQPATPLTCSCAHRCCRPRQTCCQSAEAGRQAGRQAGGQQRVELLVWPAPIYRPLRQTAHPGQTACSHPPAAPGLPGQTGSWGGCPWGGCPAPAGAAGKHNARWVSISSAVRCTADKSGIGKCSNGCAPAGLAGQEGRAGGTVCGLTNPPSSRGAAAGCAPAASQSQTEPGPCWEPAAAAVAAAEAATEAVMRGTQAKA